MTTDAVGGVWTYALDLARALAPRTRTALVVLGPSPSPAQSRDAEAIQGLSVIDTGLPLDWTATELAEIEDSSAVVRGLSRRVGADIIHLNSPALAITRAFPAPVVGVCHSCLATWWSTVKSGAMPEDFRWRTQATWRGLLACDRLVAPSTSFAQATARAYDIPPPVVVHNGRAEPPSSASSKRDAFILTTGRLWDEGKNVRTLDAAAGAAGAPLYAAGPLEGPGGVNGLSVRHAQALGKLDAEAVSSWLALAPIFASSALYEPFGLGVLEAAQAGCALVLSDIPTFRELWDGAAVFVGPDDVDGFASAFRTLLDDRQEARRLGGLAQARARRFSAEAMGDNVMAVYRDMLAQHANAPVSRAMA